MVIKCAKLLTIVTTRLGETVFINWDVLRQWNKKITGTNANCRTQDASTTIHSGKTDNDNPFLTHSNIEIFLYIFLLVM